MDDKNVAGTQKGLNVITWAVVLIILVVLVALAFILLRNRIPNPAVPPQTAIGEVTQVPVTPTSAEVIEVTYDGETFSPESLNVKTGTTVVFINQSDGQLWVASDPHPVHTNLPEFDQLKSAGRGEQYQFTFDKTGTWGFHNHIKPTAKGTVIVEE